MNKTAIVSVLLTVGILMQFVLLVVIVLNVSVFYNNMVLDSFSQQLFNSDIPEETVILEKHKICGKLNGNGDGMDFLACILIRSDKTISELEKHFETLNFMGAKLSHKTAELQVLAVTESQLRSDYLINRDIIFGVELELNRYNYYAIVIYDGGYWGLLDMRGA